MKKNALFIFVAIFLFINLSCNSQNEKNIKEKDTNLQAENKKIIMPQEEAKYNFVKSIPVPEGYERIKTEKNSYADFLRNQKLKTENNNIYFFNGDLKYSNSHFAVIVMDVGKRDLQQCADAVMRMRAEYLFSQKRYKEIHFNFLSDGKPRYYIDYSKENRSYKKFRKYMDYIFSYANTSSLKNELKKVKDIKNIQIGDVFIQKGRPYGHAVFVTDIAANKKSGEKIFMISQSYMPAQDIHILINPENKKNSPWYKIDFDSYLYTPDWNFTKDDLMRF